MNDENNLSSLFGVLFFLFVGTRAHPNIDGIHSVQNHNVITVQALKNAAKILEEKAKGALAQVNGHEHRCPDCEDQELEVCQLEIGLDIKKTLSDFLFLLFQSIVDSLTL